jgi:hypothetical protein
MPTNTTHLYHYLVLVLGLLACFLLFLYFGGNPTYQLASALAGCVFYSAWGIIHGLTEQRLNRHIAFEYLALALFGFAVLFVSVALL